MLPQVRAAPRKLSGGIAIAMPTGIPKMLKEVEVIEAGKHFEFDAAQLAKIFPKRLPVRPLDLLADGLAWDQFPSAAPQIFRSEEHTSELQSLMRITYDDFCLKNKEIYEQ